MRRDTEAAQLPEYSRICRAEYGNENFICRIRTSVVHRLPKPRRRVRLPYPAPSSRTKKNIYAKNPEVSTVSPHRYTMCHGVQSVRAKARRKLKCMSLRLAFYIRIELDRSNVDGRSFQAHPDKMLYFQSLVGFQRICSKLPNFPESIENTGQNGFLGFADNSSQIVVTPVPSRFMRKFICRLRQT